MSFRSQIKDLKVNKIFVCVPFCHEGPPAPPTGVMTTVDESQSTPSTATITLTWSASSEADNYTIMVTPPLPSGQSLLSTTTASLQLMLLYNLEYTLNVTAHNCGGTNNTIVNPSPVGNQCSIFNIILMNNILCF